MQYAAENTTFYAPLRGANHISDFPVMNKTTLNAHYDEIIRCIISTSETLTDEVKDKLKTFFGEDVGVYARYSNTEQGILGQETGVSGEYKLNWASYYFEVLKMDSDESADEGELGRIVITDLYNKAFPMIRYDTGDVARMKMGEDGELPMFSELYGRRMDLIYDLKSIIFYGLGDFIMKNQLQQRLPADFYEKYDIAYEDYGTVGLAIGYQEQRPNCWHVC